MATGIAGLDSLLHGGIPERNQVILAGGPGTGKTLLSFEYVYRNAKAGNPSMLLALEEDPNRLIDNAKSAFKEFTDIDELIASKKLVIDGQDPTTLLHAASGNSQYEFGKIISDIESILVSSGTTRLVIDSISVLDFLINDNVSYRRSMLALSNNLRRLGVTSILTTEMPTPDRAELEFRPEYFIFDGIIAMYIQGEEGRRVPLMEVIKMRGCEHSFATAPFEITAGGFNVVSPAELGE